jgi:hypothetical protein
VLSIPNHQFLKAISLSQSRPFRTANQFQPELKDLQPMKIFRIVLCIFVLFGISLAEEGTTLQPVNRITAKQIVARMTENNRKRKQELQSYTGQRQYHLLYTGFPGKREADLVVEVTYEAPASKEFRVISESGSRWMINRVFKRLLETEKAAADEKSQERTALTEDNYEFELLGQEPVDGRSSFVLRVEPKTANKLLYRGKIWIDAADYALSKIDAEPAKLPSFWISKTIVHHSYRKIGNFWLPARNESNTDVRLGGHATLSIQYGDYKVVAQTNSPDSGSPRELSMEDVIAIVP